MSEINTVLQETGIDVVQTLTVAKDLSAMSYPVMVEKSRNAAAALSTYTSINDDSQYDAAVVILGRVKATYDLVNDMRMKITAPLDALKSRLMEPEKKISILTTDKDSEYNRVKRMCNKYKQDQLDRQAEERRKVLMKQRHDEELIRLSTLMENRFTDNITNAVRLMSSSINSYLETITAENYEEKIARFNARPNLKRETFESWFDMSATQYDVEAVPAEDFMNWMKQVKEQFTYESINELYLPKAEKILSDAKSLLPELKKELDRIATLSAADQEAAAARLKQQQEDDAKKKEEELQKRADDEKAKAELAAGSKKLDLAFETQLTLQEGAVNTKGTRSKKVATITAPNAETVQVLSKVMFANFTNPKFDGIIKKDKSGANKVDDNGRPVYVDWVESLLSFYATNCSDVVIPGIELKDVIKATVKS